MISSATVRPINSIIFVSDRSGGKVPEWAANKLILSTESCISVGCYPEQDGSTELVLGDMTEVDPGYQPLFEGQLETPSRVVTITTVDEQTVLEAPVAKGRTEVRIWLSHPRWPEKVFVGLS